MVTLIIHSFRRRHQTRLTHVKRDSLSRYIKRIPPKSEKKLNKNPEPGLNGKVNKKGSPNHSQFMSSDNYCLVPGLLDVETPAEFEILVAVVVHEPAEHFIVTTEKHSRWGLLRCKFLLIHWI